MSRRMTVDSMLSTAHTAADLLVRHLVELGVDTFFGIPGGPISPLFDALARHERVTLIESRHETAAAFAATTLHRQTGRTPGVVVTAGPGITNVVTGVASAWYERASVLLICGDVAAGTGRILVQDSSVVTTPRGKGVFDERHPLSLRQGGMAASAWARRYTEAGVDVALVLGSDLDDVAVGPTPYVGDGGRLIHIDLDPRVFGRGLPTWRGVCADLGQVLAVGQALAVELGLQAPAPALLEVVRSRTPVEESAHTGLSPARVMDDLADAAPGHRLITDIGEHMLFALHYRTAEPGTFCVQLGHGSMGSGIAGAIGLALADSREPVLCICGDGGMQMMGMELLVAVQRRLPIVFLVFNDARYNMVHHGMKRLYGEAGAFETPWVDFVAWGQSFGVPGARVDAPGQLTRALLDDLGWADGPVMLDVRVDRDVFLAGGGRVAALQRMSASETVS